MRLEAERLAAIEVLVLERAEHAVVEAEAPAQSHAHPVGWRRAVERLRDRRAPVDHDRIAVGVAHMPAPDVEDLDPTPRLVWDRGGDARPGRLVVVGVAVSAAEERRRLGIGGQRLEPLSAQAAQALAGQGVNPVVGDALGRGPHDIQAAAGELEVDPLGVQHLRAVVLGR